MTETQRTFAFVGIAAVSLAVALVAAPTSPKPPKEYEEVGQEFYPQFTNPGDARQLQVVAYDTETASARPFSVEFKDGIWRIPSRHNYPVEGKDRLAKCAASIIGLKREAVAGYREAEHSEFEVVDPLDEVSSSLKRGQRIALKDEQGNVLADYIIGKQVPNRSGSFYIRRPDEKVTYTAKISLDLSTKFSDWIEPDLLKVDEYTLNGVTIDNYSVDVEQGRIIGSEQNVLTKKSGETNWSLEGLNADTEEVNQDEVRKLITALDQLKIVGVRPKPPKLQRDLKLDQGLTLDQVTVMDLQDKGFFFARSEGGGRQLVSKEGDVTATTNQGVEYLLHFGDVFSGTEEEIEFGFTKKDESASKKDEEQPKPGETLKKSRYLFVTVHSNPDAIGTKPEEPTKPEPLGELPEEAAAPTERDPDGPADVEQLDNVGPAAEYAWKKTEYDAALAKYETDKSKYATDQKTFEDKVKEGEKKVKELNARFADWYYVISGDSFENLRQGRKTLVKEKGAAPATPAGAANPPAFNFPPQ